MKHRIAVLVLMIALAAGAQTPAWAPDWFSKGISLFNAGQWTQAADELSRAASGSADGGVQITAGVALANVKRYKEAAEQFLAASRLNPDSLLPLLLLDGAYTEMGNQTEARKWRDAANRIMAAKRGYKLQGVADVNLAASLQKRPDNAIAHVLLGDLYQTDGKTASALAEYARARALAPKWAKPVFNMGLANVRSDPKAAEVYFAEAARLDPSNPRIQLWKGDAYLNQGQFARANDAYQRAAADPSLAAEARTRLGNVQLRQGNFAAASEQFGLAAKKAPQDARPIAGQAEAFQNSGRLPEAEKSYNQAAEVMSQNQSPAPSQAVVQNRIGVVRAQQNKMGQAIDSLEAGFRLQPTLDNADALARAQQRENGLAEAISRNQVALKKNPRDVSALIYLLSAYALNGDVPARIETANKLLKIDPSNAARYHAEIGAAHMAAGDTADAAEAYLKAFESSEQTAWPDIVRHAIQSKSANAVREACERDFNKEGKVRTQTGLILYELQSAQGLVSDTLKTAQRLVKLHPEQASLWLRLGLAYETAGKVTEAVQAYGRAATGSDPEAAALARARAKAIQSSAR